MNDQHNGRRRDQPVAPQPALGGGVHDRNAKIVFGTNGQGLLQKVVHDDFLSLEVQDGPSDSQRKNYHPHMHRYQDRGSMHPNVVTTTTSTSTMVGGSCSDAMSRWKERDTKDEECRHCHNGRR